MTAPPAPESAPPLRVRVPASTSNLGPGFDQLGLALELYLEVELEPVPGPPGLTWGALEGEAASWPRSGNLLTAALEAGAGGGPLPGAARLHVRSEVPAGRGLGSSGAAVAAGLCLGRSWSGSGEPLDHGTRLVLAERGLELEGHPDNVTASLFGGCTLGVPLPDGSLRMVQQALHPELLFAVAWPSSPLATERARAALPSSLPLDSVVWNTRRLSLLLEGLRRGDRELLALGVDDRLHSAWRLPLIPGAGAALDAAREAGAWLTAISGAGSALVAATDDPAHGEQLLAALLSALEAENDWARGRVLRADARGAQLVAPSSS